MSEQLLDCADVMPILKQMGRKRVAEGVEGRAFGNPGPTDGILDGPLEHGLMEVVPAPLAGHLVHVDPCGWEDPLPGPLPARVRVLPHQSPREFHPAGTALEILLVLPLHELKVPRKVGFDGGGQHRDPIPVALARPHHPG